MKNHVIAQLTYMYKKIFILFFLIFLNSCSHPGTALIGPAFTGVTTGSIGQASVSFGTNQVVKKIREATIKTKNDVKKIAKKVENLSLETKSKDFYASVKNLYLKDKNQKNKIYLIHR